MSKEEYDSLSKRINEIYLNTHDLNGQRISGKEAEIKVMKKLMKRRAKLGLKLSKE